MTSGIASDTSFGAVTPPIYLSSTFAFSGLERHRGYEYGRTAHPGRNLLAETLAKLEGGAGAVVTSREWLRSIWFSHASLMQQR